MNRRAEIQRLVKWAIYKNLEGPLKAYRSRLDDEETRLLRYRFKYPRLVRWARLTHAFGNLISPVPRYHRRGSAAHYRFSKSSQQRNNL